MINIRPILQQRIQDQVSDFREVAGAADLGSILTGRIADPGCYVFQNRISGPDGQALSKTVQLPIIDYAVITTVKNVKDAKGGDAADVSFDLQEAVRAALVGFVPSPGYAPLRYAGGALISFTDGFFIWRDNFITTTILQG